ncbi:hypothetical protein, partial [Pseudomonas sp. PS01299]|uniref:hypothetical protein n=1 Tax=Pseudomonas sp. PS01299 TaxID=2991435 RepID=UPI00249BE419
MTGFSYLSFSKRRAKQNNPHKPGLCEEPAKRQCQKSGNRFPLAAAFLPLACSRRHRTTVGAGLLAKASSKSVFVFLTHRLR